ncbi:MAG: hypothetical protein H0X49_15560 [Acidobacteria bacterium]|nr:hypothetical protein [Acidobacteriota bacterium]
MIIIALQKFGVALLTVFLLAFSVAKAQEKGASIMTFDEYAKVRHGYPYIVKLQIGKGELLYFGSRHIYDPKDAQTAQIEKLWNEFRPTVAYHESSGTSLSKTVDEAVSKSGEPGLVRFLAARDKISAFSLEPSKTDEVAMFLKTYTPEQIKVFFVLRQVPQFRERKTDETIEAFMKTFLGNVARIPGLESAPNTVAELDKSSLWLSPQLKDWRAADRSWSDPVASHAYTNQIARLSSEFRDLHMVKLLIDEVKQGERVFAVVGGSHVVMQEPVLKAASNK